jgi:hypothetical protein
MIRRLVVVVGLVSVLGAIAAPAVAATPDPLCLIRPSWCETP